MEEPVILLLEDFAADERTVYNLPQLLEEIRMPLIFLQRMMG